MTEPTEPVDVPGSTSGVTPASPSGVVAAAPASPVSNARRSASLERRRLSASRSEIFSSESPASLDAMYASTIDVSMNTVAAVAVRRRRNVDAPAPPNTEPAFEPPNAPPMPPPLPCCNSTVSMRNRHTRTCRIVTRVDMEGVD